ncbi:bromo adjacent homology domain-containing 1 protein [Trichomycterus rosablanca]|uniref:bromo adjacent homology domain-containing 1 protein n=1 Tax=Trichomycterus rosablanca TaxID=2290929 RepID=UPI002F35B799
MSQARKKGSCSHHCEESQNRVDDWSYCKTKTWPDHCLKEVRVLARKGVTNRGKQKRQEHKEGSINNEYEKRARLDCSAIQGTTMKVVSEKGKKKGRTEPKRKLYPLRGRSSSSKDEDLSCSVLLARLEKDALEQDSNLQEEDGNTNLRKHWHKKSFKPNQKLKKAKDSLHTKFKSEATINKTLSQEPRKRRLASLNAEAVNSLLLEKKDATPGSKLAKKQLHEAAPVPTAPINKKNASVLKNAAEADKTEMCQGQKHTIKSKLDVKDVNEMSLFIPTPRRLAGLNAAALLKLTSSTTEKKLRSKVDRKGVGVVGKQAACSRSKVQRPKKQRLKQALTRGGAAERKSRESESKLRMERGTHGLTHGTHGLNKTGYQSCSVMGYPLKVVKDEPVETEISPCFCCAAEGPVEYCHRVALLLRRKAYSETDDHSVASVKHECLVASSSVAHPALTLSAHPCLCADPCYSGYYVHIAHHGPHSASLSTKPLPCPHSAVCPSRVPGANLLSSHASGLSHPAFCHTVCSPCYSEGCRVGSYAFADRACTYNTGCTNCSHQIKTEGYMSPQSDQSSSLLVPPSLPLPGCPLPRLNQSTVLPHLLSTVIEKKDKEVKLQGAKKCPQSSKPTNSSIGVSTKKLSQKRSVPSQESAKQQKKVNRSHTTNGWRRFGEPTEKEVYIAGEVETALRQCYEGVQRDGEVIRVRDTVLLRSGPRKKTLPYVAKISALWDDPKTGELMMSLFWYYRPEHTQGGRDPSMHCENEIFASRHQDENSVACIEDKCYVLPLAEYCRFCALVKRRSEGLPNGTPMVPQPSDSAIPSYRLVPEDVDPELVYVCRHVYDFRSGRILKNPQ